MQHFGPTRFGYGSSFAKPPRATFAIMVATAATSLITMIDSGRFGANFLENRLFFSPSQVLDLWRIWTPFTYLFLAGNPLHLLLYEVIALWMFASSLERQWGERRFLYYFFGTSTGAALLTTVLGLFSTSLRVFPYTGTIVAGEAIFVGWILTNWNATVLLFFMIPVRAPYFLFLAVGMPVLYILMGVWTPFIPVLLAMSIGYVMLRRGRISPKRLLVNIYSWWLARQIRRKSRHLRVVPPSRDDSKRPPNQYLH